MPSKQQLLDRQRMAETEHFLSKILYSTGVWQNPATRLAFMLNYGYCLSVPRLNTGGILASHHGGMCTLQLWTTGMQLR